jgi:soluble lytic murein transglycosylase-like protein
MADNDTKRVIKTIDDLFSTIADTNIKAARSAVNLGKSFDELSKAGAQKLLDQMKEQIKQGKLMTKEQLSHIKTVQDLTNVLDHYESTVEKVNKIQKENAETIKKIQAGQITGSKKWQEQADKYRKALEEATGLSHKEAEALKDTTKSLKDLSDSQSQAMKRFDHISKASEKLHDTIAGKIASYISIGKGIEDMAKGGKQAVDEWIKISQNGLQGAFLQVQMSAVKLRMSFEEFSEVLGKHRDIVLELGGGAVGVAKFGEYLDEASKGLSYLGKDAKKATASFAGTIQHSGIGINDRDKFDDAMNAMQTQYKKFAALYGDDYETYSSLVDLQAQDEVIQGRMIGLGRKQLGVVAQEIRARVENEKLLGMSNEQLTDFNRKVNDIINPENTDLQGQQTGAINAQNAIAMMLRMDPNNEGLKSASQTLQPLINAMGSGDINTFQKIASSKEGISALSTVNTARDKIFNRPGSRSIDRLPLNTFLNGSPQFRDLLKGTNGVGMAKLNGSDAESNLAKMNQDQLAGLKDSVEATGAFATAMNSATTALQQYEATMNNSAVKFGQGVGEVILGIIGAELLKTGGGKLLTLIRSLIGASAAEAGAGAAGAGEAAAAAAAGGSAAAAGGAMSWFARMIPFAARVGGGASLMLHSDNLNTGEDSYLKSRQNLSSNIAEASKITGVDPSVLAAIANQESGGKSNAKNSNSTATGLFQFTEGTWLDTVKKYGSAAGINTQGMSRDQILALRNDPRASAIMGAFYIRDGQRATGAQTGGGMYLAHLLGPGGARAVLNANPNTPLNQLVDSKAYAANSKLFGQTQTAGGLLNWANNKIGGKVDTTPITNAVAGMGGDANGSGPATDSQGNTVLDASQVDGQQTIELQKQTALLAQIASNTGGSRRSIVPESKKAPGTRREISGG